MFQHEIFKSSQIHSHYTNELEAQVSWEIGYCLRSRISLLICEDKDDTFN